MVSSRRTGVLLHLSSLPDGTMGDGARNWVDFLAQAAVSSWQLLPICPTDPLGSPYSSHSVFAGNPALIDRQFLTQAPYHFQLAADPHDLHQWHQAMLIFCDHRPGNWQEFHQFVESQHWLQDYALYLTLKQHYLCHWTLWPEPLRSKQHAAIHEFRAENSLELQAVYFQQFIFFQQWQSLKAYANQHSIEIIGDMPIFVAHDSADCWANQHFFLLHDDGKPQWVAGVPPDYFSATGQRWGNPQYDWHALQKNQFSWWQERLVWSFQCFDRVRVDHFRGFEASWYIPADEDLAINGHWQPIPGEALFQQMQKQFGELPIIAEDLGIITAEVEALRDKFGFPGMKVLQFAFDGSDDNPYLPVHHIPNCVVYTGTHDNNTIVGWFNELDADTRSRVMAVVGGKAADMPWPMIETALASVADTVIVPLQDLLALDARARMNTPGTSENNWQWRFDWTQLTPQLACKLAALNRHSARTPVLTAT